MEKSILGENLMGHGSVDCSTLVRENYEGNQEGLEKDPRHSFGKEFLSGFSWPPRSYTCSFCKREFRSAQALGGHMNVHRRDRARLRQCSPPALDLNSHPSPFCPDLDDAPSNPIPNPNPNPTIMSLSSPPSPSLSTALRPKFAHTTLPAALVTSFNAPSSTYLIEEKKWVNAADAPPVISSSMSLPGFDRDKAKAATNKKSFWGFGETDNNCVIEGEDYKKGLKRSEIRLRLDLEIGLLGEYAEDDLDLELRLGCT